MYSPGAEEWNAYKSWLIDDHILNKVGFFTFLMCLSGLIVGCTKLIYNKLSWKESLLISNVTVCLHLLKQSNTIFYDQIHKQKASFSLMNCDLNVLTFHARKRVHSPKKYCFPGKQHTIHKQTHCPYNRTHSHVHINMIYISSGSYLFYHHVYHKKTTNTFKRQSTPT